MRVGIPKGLLFYKYKTFYETFFTELGAEIVESPDTNKNILDEGIKYSVDEACLPVKIFHGHAAYLKDKSDIVFIPRIMSVSKKEFICPKFCGLPEMIKNDIQDMPQIIDCPIYAESDKDLYKSLLDIGQKITKNHSKINDAFKDALKKQSETKVGIDDEGYKTKVALIGHPYNLYDSFVNMNIVKKLHKLGIGIITSEYVGLSDINAETLSLFKKPFWTFARYNYGFSTYLYHNKLIDGMIYISSFSCGEDPIIIELIKQTTGNFPFLILKIDEHTGEAGFDTRLEAFSDMLERRISFENNFSTSR